MEKEYIFGYLPSEADKMTLDEIYTYLIGKGVIDNTVSKNDLAIILEGVIKSITPDMIRGNVTIAGVTGNVATKVEEIYVDKFDSVEIPSYTYPDNKITILESDYETAYEECFGYYEATSKDGIDSYHWHLPYTSSTRVGIYYKNLQTNTFGYIPINSCGFDNEEVICTDDNAVVIPPTARYLRREYPFIYLFRGKAIFSDLPTSSSSAVFHQIGDAFYYTSSTSKGLHLCLGGVHTVYGDTTSVYTFKTLDNGDIYAYDKHTIFYLTSSGVVLVHSNSNAHFIGCAREDTIYFCNRYNIIKINKGIVVQEYSNPFAEYNTTTWYLYESKKDKTLYVSSTAGPGLYKLESTTFNMIYSDTGGWFNFFETSTGRLYIQNSSSSVNPICVELDGTCTSITLSSKYWTYVNDIGEGCIIVSSNSSTYKGAYRINGGTYNQVISTGYYWNGVYKDIYDRYFLYSAQSASYGPGLYYISSTSCVQLHTSYAGWTFKYDKNNNMYAVYSNNAYLYIPKPTDTEVIHDVTSISYSVSKTFIRNDLSLIVADSSYTYHICDGIRTPIYSISDNSTKLPTYNSIFETGDNTLYLLKSSGILYRVSSENTTFEQVTSSHSTGIQYFIQDTGDYIIMGNSSSFSGASYVTALTKNDEILYIKNYYYSTAIVKNGITFITGDANSTKTYNRILIYDKQNITEITLPYNISNVLDIETNIICFTISQTGLRGFIKLDCTTYEYDEIQTQGVYSALYSLPDGYVSFGTLGILFLDDKCEFKNEYVHEDTTSTYSFVCSTDTHYYVRHQVLKSTSNYIHTIYALNKSTKELIQLIATSSYITGTNYDGYVLCSCDHGITIIHNNTPYPMYPHSCTNKDVHRHNNILYTSTYSTPYHSIALDLNTFKGAKIYESVLNFENVTYLDHNTILLDYEYNSVFTPTKIVQGCETYIITPKKFGGTDNEKL